MDIKPLTMAFVISCIFVLTACNHIYVDGYRVNFDEWQLAEYDFAPFPEGISFTPAQNIFTTDAEWIYANLSLTIGYSPYILRHGNAILIKLVNNEWRYVPWAESWGVSHAGMSVVNDYSAYRYRGHDIRISHLGFPSEFFRYGFIPGTYRYVSSRARLERLDLIDDTDIIRSIVAPNVTDEEWERRLPYVGVPLVEYETVWEGTIWTEDFTIAC